MNYNTIYNLPRVIEADSGQLLQVWVTQLPLRHQGTLSVAIRGCDTSSKEDRSKPLVRLIRRAILNPSDSRESLMKRGFFGFDPKALAEDTGEFLHSLDQYPLHFVAHLMLACEVIGYKHPNAAYRAFFNSAYQSIVFQLHLRPEPEEEMDLRLTEDRVSKGISERDFPSPQTVEWLP